MTIRNLFSGDADAMRHKENHQPYKMYFVVQALTAWTGIKELKELKTLENCCDLTPGNPPPSHTLFFLDTAPW